MQYLAYDFTTADGYVFYYVFLVYPALMLATIITQIYRAKKLARKDNPHIYLAIYVTLTVLYFFVTEWR